MGKNGKYGSEFTLLLVRAYLKGETVCGLASRFGIDESMLRRWGLDNAVMENFLGQSSQG